MGHIYKRNGKWSYRVSTGKSPEGKRTSKTFSGFSSQRKAMLHMAKTEVAIAEGTFFTQQIKFSEVVQRWQRNNEIRIRKSTRNKYNTNLKVHLIPWFGERNISEIKPTDIEDYYYYKIFESHKTLSPNTIRDQHKMLKVIFKEAMKMKILESNPLDIVTPPRPNKPRVNYWDEEESKSFLDLAKTERLYPVFLIALTTGMRKAEILGLRWRDIDIKSKTISVRQTLNRAGEVEEAKSSSSYRSINVSNKVIDELLSWKQRQDREREHYNEEYREPNLVITSLKGTPYSDSNVNRVWFRLLEKSGLPKIRFHDLRHTHATLLLKEGIHPKIVSERLGHSKISVTLDIYSHIIKGIQEVAAEAIDNLLF